MSSLLTGKALQIGGRFYTPRVSTKTLNLISGIPYTSIWNKVSNHKGNEVKQLLVSCKHRATVMKQPLECLLGVHLGAKETDDGILSSFCWSGVTADMKTWCRSYDAC